MRIQVLPATVGRTPGHPLTGFLVDGVLAVDAGPLGAFGTAEEQALVTDVLLTHSHIDHVAGLPLFLDNVYGLRPNPPTIHGLPATLKALQSDLFNDRMMPDFLGMSTRMAPFLKTSEITPHRPFPVGPYTATALPVEHSVPTVAYLIDDKTNAAAFVTDTSPIPEVLIPLARWPRLKAVFLECSFPKRMGELARVSQHLTTDDFAAAAKLFPASVSVYATHIKPRYWNEVTAELKALGLQWAEGGRVVEV